MKSLRFSVLPGEWVIARLAPVAPLPAWVTGLTTFSSITRTAEELSIVVPAVAVPDDVRAERGWTLFQLQGPFAFDQTGILASIAMPLAAAGVGIFALSTFDTDYLLVKTTHLACALAALLAAGHVQN